MIRARPAEGRTTKPSRGQISRGNELSLRRIVRDGDVVVGEAMEVPSDQWMTASFGSGWDE